MEPDQPGQWQAGTTFRVARHMGLRPSEIRSSVAELEPNRRMDIRGLSGPSFQGHLRSAPAGSGTRLQWNGELRLTGIARLFEPLIARSFGKGVDENFAKLKRILEGEQ